MALTRDSRAERQAGGTKPFHRKGSVRARYERRLKRLRNRRRSVTYRKTLSLGIQQTNTCVIMPKRVPCESRADRILEPFGAAARMQHV